MSWLDVYLDFSKSPRTMIFLYLWCKAELLHDGREEEEEFCSGKTLSKALPFACKVFGLILTRSFDKILQIYQHRLADTNQ